MLFRSNAYDRAMLVAKQKVAEYLATEIASNPLNRWGAPSSNSVRPHRRQPTRHPCPWDSPGKDTGVDCHFLLQCMKVKSESEVAQSCLTLSDPMDCSLPGSSIHGIGVGQKSRNYVC